MPYPTRLNPVRWNVKTDEAIFFKQRILYKGINILSQSNKKMPKLRDVQRNPMKPPPSSKLFTPQISSTVSIKDTSLTKLGKTDICPRCNGFGGLESGGGCKRCDGTGFIVK